MPNKFLIHFSLTLIFNQTYAKLTLIFNHPPSHRRCYGAMSRRSNERRRTRKTTIFIESMGMKRIIDHYLNSWKTDRYRKPLLLRGARQVGKTHAARTLGATFLDFFEINLEDQPATHIIFEKDLDPERILRELSALKLKPIIPGKTLLFIDEIQAVPRALLALRYFYEKMPELHVIAAGSLLDFAIEEVGIPVGRVDSLYMRPLSFIEFLCAVKAQILVEEIVSHTSMNPISEVIHNKLLGLVGEYLAIGGMPEAVNCWQEIKDPLRCPRFHKSILTTYRQDFGKYARQKQVKYVDLLFDHIPLQLGQQFKYSMIEGDFRKRELSPALDLLVTAGIAQKVYASAGHGIPLGAQIDALDYKVIFLDIALAQKMLGLQTSGWYINPLIEFVNKGALVEAFIGQEILTCLDPSDRSDLYYWHRKERSSNAEVDYLIQQDEYAIPVEVKSGEGRTLKSIQMFLETHPKSPYGIRFSTQNYSEHNKIRSYPLYAACKLGMWQDELRKAFKVLL